MTTVRFTKHLRRFFPKLVPTELDVVNVAELVAELDVMYPGLAGYIVNDNGALRKHVNIFVNGAMIEDRDTLTDRLNKTAEVYIMQALSGG